MNILNLFKNLFVKKENLERVPLVGVKTKIRKQYKSGLREVLTKECLEQNCNKTLKQIAQEFNCSPTIIRRYYSKLGVSKVDTRHFSSGPRWTRRIKLSREELVEFLEKNKELTLKEVGDHFGVSRERIRQLYVKFGIIRARKLKRFELLAFIRQKVGDQKEILKSLVVEAAKACNTQYSYTQTLLSRKGYKFLTDADILLAQGKKKCYKCKKIKAIVDFHKSRNLKAGVTSGCKECAHIHSLAYYKRKISGNPMKKCCGCQQRKLLSKFYKNKAMGDGYSGYCKICQDKSQSKYNKSKNRHKLVELSM